jgi:chromosome segregation ATPase
MLSHAVIPRSKVIKTSSSKGKGKGKSQPEETLEPIFRSIFEAFQRGDEQFEKIFQQYQQQGEDIEMMDEGVTDIHNSLKNTIDELRKDHELRAQLDDYQKEQLLKECQIFGTRMTTEGLKTQHELTELKKYVDATVTELRMVTQHHDQRFSIMLGNQGILKERMDRMETQIERLEDENQDLTGRLDRRRNDVRRLQDEVQQLENTIQELQQ